MLIPLVNALEIVTESLSLAKEGAKVSKKNLNLVKSNGSMTKLLGKMIVEPSFVVSDSLRNSPFLDDVLSFQLNMFATLYANAFNSLVNIHEIDVDVALSVMSSGKGDYMDSNHSFFAGNESSIMDLSMLPSGALSIEEMMDLTVANEAKRNPNYGNNKHVTKKAGPVTQAKVSDRSGKFDKEPSMYFKNLVINVSANGREIEIPIMVRADVQYHPWHEIRDYVTLEGDDTSFFARTHKLRSGGISLKEYILCTDLVENYGDKLMNSDGKSLIEKAERRKSEALKNAGHMMKGFGRDFNALILSSDEKNFLNAAIKNKIDNEDAKDVLLYRTASYTISFMDERYERLSTLTSNINGTSIIKYDKLKQKDDRQEDTMKALFQSLSGGDKIRL